MIKVDNKFAANKYVEADKYIPNDNRTVIVLTRQESYDDYDLGFYDAVHHDWFDIATGIPIFPNYWREIPKID